MMALTRHQPRRQRLRTPIYHLDSSILSIRNSTVTDSQPTTVLCVKLCRTVGP